MRIIKAVVKVQPHQLKAFAWMTIVLASVIVLADFLSFAQLHQATSSRSSNDENDDFMISQPYDYHSNNQGKPKSLTIKELDSSIIKKHAKLVLLPSATKSDSIEKRDGGASEFNKQNYIDDDSPDISFGSLRLCEPKASLYFECDNDPTCLSPKCEHHGKNVTFGDPLNWNRFWEEKQSRRDILQSILRRMEAKMGPNPDKQLIIMSFNSGFSHLFGNWFCSLRAHDVDIDSLKRRLLPLPTDEGAIEYVESLGFFSPKMKEIVDLRRWTNLRFSESASQSFGQGSHAALNLFLKFAMPLDLTALGYTILIQDVDAVWAGDAQEAITKNYCRADDNCDAAFISESRPYIAWKQLKDTESWRRPDTPFEYPGYPEANTGMFLLRPSAPVRTILKTLMEGNRLQQWKHRDQLLWNAMLHHRAFSHLNFTILPPSRFVPGKHLRRQHVVVERNPLPTKPELLAMHISDTSSFIHKFERLQFIKQWHFNESNAYCSSAVSKCRQIKKCWNPVDTLLQKSK